MENYIRILKIRMEVLQEEVEYLEREQKIRHAKHRKLLIDSYKGNIQAAKDLLWHLDRPVGMMH